MRLRSIFRKAMARNRNRSSHIRCVIGIIVALALAQAGFPLSAYAAGTGDGGEESIAFYVIGGLAAVGIGFFVGGPGLVKDVREWWHRIRH